MQCEVVRGTGPALLVHGGAWDIPPEEREAHQTGALAAARLGLDSLRGGAAALDTVEAVVTLLEDDPALNAGTGSVLNRRGEAVLDASIMDGEDLRVGGVAAVRTVRNPVRVARRVIEATRQVLLAGPGAEEFAREQGFEAIRPEELVVPREVERLRAHRARRRAAAPGDTVGAVAIDGEGRIAAAGSTGGTLNKRPGRVGDTPLPGAGLYADSRVGGVACTGWGEGIARLSMARAVLARIEGGQDPADAARELLAACWSRLGGTAGLLIVTPDSRLVTAWSTPRMARGWAHGGMETPAAAA
ncbi:MAG: peptidase T [Acidobacteria bacterium]|nr:peptidase T [Acidobacteriota bacterium]MYF13626.1 peptidase T [Acidobacteriota bacterium]MYI95382.1 peptidase T [Acidobacteriota bacterium]